MGSADGDALLAFRNGGDRQNITFSWRNSSDAAATCTGTAMAANTTCDLDGGTDGSADCPAGCSVTAAVSGVRTEPCDAGSWATADVGWAHVACDRAGGRVVLVTLGSPRRAGGLGGDITALAPLTQLRSLSLSANKDVYGDIIFLTDNMPELRFLGLDGTSVHGDITVLPTATIYLGESWTLPDGNTVQRGGLLLKQTG